MAAGHRRGRKALAAPAGALAVAVLVPLATLLVAAWVQGWQLQPVISPSMEPTYPEGSLLVVAPVDPADVEVGSTLVFAHPDDADRRVAHRVTEVVDRSDGRWFRTQGDANRAVDARLVASRQVRGRVLWSVSHLGGVTDALRGSRGFVALVALPGLLLVAGEGRQLCRRRRASNGQRRASTVEPAPPHDLAIEPGQVLEVLMGSAPGAPIRSFDAYRTDRGPGNGLWTCRRWAAPVATGATAGRRPITLTAPGEVSHSR